ncbi:MAG: hypothetical protein ABSF24_06630 [Candidatus Bathyarchaeia archaeon]|jgi:hypothetical protein
MSQQPQQSLDRTIVLGQVEELRKTVEDVRAALDELKQRIIKLEADAGVTETGLSAVASALELRGILKNGEPVQEKEPAAAVKEETFAILKWESQQGAKIGSYDVAYEASNLEDKWTSAFNILRQNNSTIKDRYHGQGYEFSYWLYGEGKIYKQRLKAKT